MNKIKIKEIFYRHWNEFVQKQMHLIPKKLQKWINKTVEKMLGCGDVSYGYAEYRCLRCTEYERLVPFTCKSRFCTSCNYSSVSRWAEKLMEKMFPIQHRHLVFTLPKELRGKIYWKRALLKDLSEISAQTVIETIRRNKRNTEVMVGIITVIHTYGRDMKFNPHVHVLITEGGLIKNTIWHDIGYINYLTLRKKWQYLILKRLKEKLGDKTKSFINKLYEEHPKGFYVNAERKIEERRGIVKYLGRYLCRPAIAESRIKSYDEEEIEFWYEDHATKKKVEVKMPVMQFMGRLVSHIPPKNFHLVRRYGLYQGTKNNSVYKIIERIKSKNITYKFRKILWRERLKISFGKDPLICPKCGKELDLYSIWHPKYGYIYHLIRDAPVVAVEETKTPQPKKIFEQLKLFP